MKKGHFYKAGIMMICSSRPGYRSSNVRTSDFASGLKAAVKRQINNW